MPARRRYQSAVRQESARRTRHAVVQAAHELFIARRYAGTSLTTPAGFEDYVAAVGQPAAERRLPDPAPIDPAVLGHAAARYPVEILGPPPVPPS